MLAPVKLLDVEEGEEIHWSVCLLYWREVMRAASATGKARALVEEGVKIVLPSRSQGLGRVAAVDQPAPAHHGGLPCVAGTRGGFERHMVLLGKNTQEDQTSGKIFASSFFGSGLRSRLMLVACLLLV